MILSDPVLRRSWWDTEGIAQPKLKAAILVSVARALPEIAESLGSPRALRLYRIFGSDHGSDSSTTSWLLEGPSRSPLNEVRVASYALLAAALRIPGAAIALVGPADVASHRSLLSVLLGPDREPTANAQRARFDLLGAFWEVHQAMSLEDDPKTLKSLRAKIALGPHGRPVSEINVQMHRCPEVQNVQRPITFGMTWNSIFVLERRIKYLMILLCDYLIK